jgi:hypothetical protein
MFLIISFWIKIMWYHCHPLLDVSCHQFLDKHYTISCYTYYSMYAQCQMCYLLQAAINAPYTTTVTFFWGISRSYRFEVIRSHKSPKAPIWNFHQWHPFWDTTRHYRWGLI